MYFFCLRYSIYTGIATLVMSATIYPVTRGAVSLLILGYTTYILLDTLRLYSDNEDKSTGNRLLRLVLSVNGFEFAYLIFAVIVGIYIGIVK
jgi:hypothetical protein